MSNLPPGPNLDKDALVAAVELIGRTGATGFEFGYLNRETTRVEDADWYAQAMYRGARITVEHQPGPVEAAEALAARLLHGGKCLGCGKLIAINDDPVPVPGTLVDGTRVDPEQARQRGLCRWAREGKHWMRGCGQDAPAGSTREKLAKAMAEAGAPGEAIRLAREGYYDEWIGPLDLPIPTLIADLEKNGLPELAERARNGEFDGTEEESDAWAASEDGQAAFAQLIGDVEQGATRAGAGSPPPEARTENPPPGARTDGRPPWRAKRRKGKNR